MKWKRFLGTLCCHKAVFLRGVTSTLNSFYATKRQPLLFFNEKCGLAGRRPPARPPRRRWRGRHCHSYGSRCGFIQFLLDEGVAVEPVGGVKGKERGHPQHDR